MRESQATDNRPRPSAASADVQSILSITKLLPFGLAGELPDGSRGIVREREIAWDEAGLRNWRERFRVGETHVVKLLNKRPDYWELSLRLVQRDPWTQASAYYQCGKLVNGFVARFWGGAAVIELEPGITGILYPTELPAWLNQPLDEALWIGDWLRTSIRYINIEQREIELSAKHLLVQRWEQMASTEKQIVRSISTPKRSIDSELHETVSSTTNPTFDWGRHAILVIEDDPAQNEAIRRWLKNAGQIVQGAHNADDGLALLQQKQFDYLLCDLGLPGTDGITVMQEALELNGDLRGILMTDWATADQRYQEIVALEEKGVLLLLKPILPEELLTALQRTKDKQKLSHFQKTERQSKQLIDPTPAHSVRSSQKNLSQLLYHLRSETRASKVVLFQFDPQNRTVQISGQSGSGKLNQDALTKLTYSPVRDIAEDGLTIHIDDVETQEGYVRYLKPLLRFRSCVGVPIMVNQEQRYALLLFHIEPDFTGGVIEQEARITAIQIRALIEQQLFLDQAAELQRTVLLGHLSRALIHETNHQMNPILFNLSDLQRQCARVQQALEQKTSQAGEEVREAQKTLQQLSENVQKLVKITRMFGRVTIQDRKELVSIDRIAEESMELVRDLADRARVQLHFHASNTPLVTRAKFTQVQQVLLNLLLNAIQQIQLIRPNEGGQIHLSLRITHTRDNGNLIRVLIEDDGPGIHQRLWERIFDLGMTTRQGEGSGLGLFIARRLIENAGGHVYVDESRLLWGTRVAAEFPIATDK